MNRFDALDMLLRSVESGSFSAAAKQLGLTPAAVSKQVARLERELKVQLLRRSTRSLSLTEAGERLVAEAGPGLAQVRAALESADAGAGEVEGIVRVSVAPAFGRRYVIPALQPLLDAQPRLRIDWHLDNRRADLVAEGFDAGISGGVELTGTMVSRTLAPLHLVAAASPALLARLGVTRFERPEDLSRAPAVALRSEQTGRPRPWVLHNGAETVRIDPQARQWFNDPEGVCDAAVAGAGVALVGMSHALPHLASGRLVRLLPQWWGDAGVLQVYFAMSRMLPRKTRLFVDALLEAARRDDWAIRLDARTAPSVHADRAVEVPGAPDLDDVVLPRQRRRKGRVVGLALDDAPDGVVDGGHATGAEEAH